MTDPGPVLMMGWNQHWLTALDDLLPAASVVVVEEPDVYAGKRIAARWSGHPVVRDVLFAEYQQTDRFLDVVAGQQGSEPVRCVLPALEYSVEAAAKAAEMLGLPGAGVAAARVFRDKITQVTTCQSAGIAVPRFAEVADAGDVAAFGGPGPLVVKPANRQASLGVVIVDPGDDPELAWKECTNADEGPQLAHRELRWRFLAQEFVPGPEYSVEALVTNGEIVFSNVTRKRVKTGRYPVEAGHVVPAPAEPGVAELPALMQKLASAAGFGTGLLHGEWIIRDETPVFVECAARPAGDWIFDLIDLVTGVNLYDASVRALSGDDPLAGRRATGLVPAAAVRFGFPDEPGTVASVSGVQAASTAPGVVRVPHAPAPGDEIRSLGSSWGRLGAVIATGQDWADAESAAAGGLDQIVVTMRSYR